MHVHRRSLALVFGGALALSACSDTSSSSGGDDEDGGGTALESAGDRHDGGTDGGTDGGGAEPIDIGHFAIDATEVSNGQYEEFLAVDFTDDDLQLLLPPECGFKVSAADFVPDDFTPTAAPDLPVVNVDWCDATAYCSWAGKRLCGELGGGPARILDLHNPTKNEWYRACTHAGITHYPYGPNYDPSACNTADSGLGALAPVASFPGCEGGFTELFDMSGNVWEWTNACNDQDECRRRGGSYFSAGVTAGCGIDSVRARDFRNQNHGFRCCEDLE